MVIVEGVVKESKQESVQSQFGDVPVLRFKLTDKSFSDDAWLELFEATGTEREALEGAEGKKVRIVASPYAVPGKNGKRPWVKMIVKRVDAVS